jgi:hypothetical protein
MGEDLEGEMTIPSWAKVGAKVVCVDDSVAGSVLRIVRAGFRPAALDVPLVSGKTYTISAINVHPVFGSYCVRLSDLASRSHGSVTDWGYDISRFRPLVTQQDDVALFAHHLDREPNKAHGPLVDLEA